MANPELRRAERFGRWAAVVVLAILTWRFAAAPLDARLIDSFLHLPDLVFHEAGHVLFSPFGRFMTVLGGSLFQILVPLICAVAFARSHDNWFAAAVCTWWAGQNLVDIAPYIADARSLRIPLIGGRTGAEVEGHDWEYILSTLGWLHLDRTLGRAAHVLGAVVMIASVAWAAVLAWKPREEPTSGASSLEAPTGRAGSRAQR